MGVKDIIKTVLPDDTIVRMKDTLNFINNKRMLQKHAKILPYEKGAYPKGINLMGDIKAETGLGQSMRHVARLLKYCEIPFVVVQLDSPGGLSRTDHEFDSYIVEEPKYSINLIHVNANIWAETYLKLPQSFLDKRYQICFWLWELMEFPKKWQPCIETLDECWTPSEFISDSLRKCTDKTVRTLPYVVSTKPSDKYDRAYFDLPEDRFLFLMMYDFKSISERKNPKAAIAAYKGFYNRIKELNGERPGLVVKVNHLKGGKELEMLKGELEGIDDVYYITENLEREQVDSLMKNVDVLISLHRSEGFGLPIAEAMQMGTPVIATDWSANVEFASGDGCIPISYELIKLEKQIGPYEKGNVWADAKMEDASEAMYKLWSDKAYMNKMREGAPKTIEQALGYEVISKRFMEYYEIL